jgi:hypothetical protein
MMTCADPSMAWATGLDGLLSWLAIWAADRPRENLRVVLRARQDVPIGDVEERDRPGLVGAVHVGGHVEGADEPGVQRVWACSGRPALSASSVVRSVSSVLW